MKADNPEAEVKKADAGEPSLGAIMSAIQALGARMDQLENAEAAEMKPDGNMPGAELSPAGAVPAPAASPDNAVASPEIGKIQARVDALEAKSAPVPEEEAAAMADAQAKADSVYQAFGDAAPRPMLGESLIAYRKRLVGKMQAHSPTFRNVDLAAVADSGLLAVIEKGVYADAQTIAHSPASIPAGLLIESKKLDDAGRTIREFRGSPNAWMSQFKVPKQRVTRINKQFN